jgi:hypothetical protein
MTSERDIERTLDRWFADRPTVVADRVLDEVADRIGRQPQQPAWRVSWRDSHVNTYFKPLLAVAAIVVFAAAGFVILRPPNPSVGGPSAPVPSPSANPTAAPTVSPTAVPSTSAVFPAWFPEQSDGSGILPAGSQTTRQFLAGSTFTVPKAG